MEKLVRAAFDRVTAEQPLVERTQAAVLAEMGRQKRRPAASVRRLAAAACVLVLLLGAGAVPVFAVPVSVICVEVNPALELELNRFDRVVGVEGLNPEGEALKASLQLWGCGYREAVERIVQSETVTTCLAESGEITVTVSGNSEARSQSLLQGVSVCDYGTETHVYCAAMTPEETELAAELGMSPGKYGAYLRLAELGESMDPAAAAKTPMRELRERICRLETEETDAGTETVCQDTGGSGNGAGGQHRGENSCGGQNSGDGHRRGGQSGGHGHS